jgi:hypothetical protein
MRLGTGTLSVTALFAAAPGAMLALAVRLHEADLVEFMTLAAGFSVARLAISVTAIGGCARAAITIVGAALRTLSLGTTLRTALTTPFALASLAGLAAVTFGTPFGATLERLALAIALKAALAALAGLMTGTIAVAASFRTALRAALAAGMSRTVAVRAVLTFAGAGMARAI